MQQQSPQRQGQDASATGAQAPHILLVDDDVDILDVLVLLFQEDGFRTSSCTTPQQAMAVIDEGNLQLFITDWRLLGGDGLELVRYVQKRFNASIPVILLTAAGQPTAEKDVALLEEIGVRVVPKPFDIDRLARLAHELLD